MRKNRIKPFLGWRAKKGFNHSKLKIQNSKLGFRGQVLGTALIMGAVILIFALAMVSMLRTSIALSNKARAGDIATLGADAAVDKGVNILTQGSNWGSSPGLSFTPIPGYKGDRVYTDIPNTQYIVQINPGNLAKAPGDQPQPTNLSSPPGDPAYERTITVDMYTFPKGYPTPSAAPTPWVMAGGSIPASFLNHRTIQTVVRRGAMADSLQADGTINVGGHWQIYWGDVYDYDQNITDPTVTVLSLGNSQGLGPGYPAFHTQIGCISSSGSCAGCFGGGGGFSGATYCHITDTGASNCQMYPNDPNMPPEPNAKLELLKAQAKQIYFPNGGTQSSGESGYFYNAQMTPGPGNTNSVSVGGAGAANEGNHQYSGAGGFSFFHGQPPAVITRMQQNLLLSNSWVGNDDMVFFADTTDGLTLPIPPAAQPNSLGSCDFKQAAFRGTFVLMGDFTDAGSGGGGPATPMAPPSAAWCPAAFTGNPDVNGLLYVGGNFSSTGNPIFYGSVAVRGNVSGAGTPKIYYRGDFKYNLISSGTVGNTKWQEIKYFPTPMP